MNTMQKLLDQYQDAGIQIVSGESEGEGTAEDYDEKRSMNAIMDRLIEERCNGDRWARAIIDTSGDEEYGADMETGEQRAWA